MENKSENKKTSLLIMPFSIILYLFVNAFYGIRFVFIRIPVILYDIVSIRLDKTYQKFHGENIKPRMEENDNNKNSKQKTYKYSAETLNKMSKIKAELQKELESDTEVRSKELIVFYYKAMNKDGKIVSGTMNGYSKQDVNSFLLNEGYEVYDIKTSNSINFLYGDKSLFKPKMSVKDLLFWLTQLSTYLKAGITLTEAVKILSHQMGKKSKAKERAFNAISYELSLGENFSDALEKQGNMFPGLLINMIKAAEATGTLIETLDDMANYYNEMDKTKKQMISAMTYPSIIMVFALGVVSFILVWVIPQFSDIYNESGMEISGLTLFIMNASNFLQKNGLMLLLAIVGVILVLYILYKSIIVFRTMVQSILMHLPVVGNIIIYNELTIFTKTFASLLKNNVFITDSMNILTKITNNEIYKNIMYSTINNIVKGNKISDSFKNHWAIPDVAYYMIVTGESTGELAQMMDKVSQYYEEMHRNVISNLKSFIEPIMIVSLALIVGVIILAVIIPMFGAYSGIS